MEIEVRGNLHARDARAPFLGRRRTGRLGPNLRSSASSADAVSSYR